MEFLEEIFYDGKRMDVNESKEEGDQLITNCKICYIQKS
jgi:hypothetical protein